MDYYDVNAELLVQFPDFNLDEFYDDLPYLVAYEFIQYLVKTYQAGDLVEFKKGFDFIELLHLSDDARIRELATIGYLEALPFPEEQKLITSDDIYGYLGTESKKWYDELIRFWSGKVRYVGETFATPKL